MRVTITILLLAFFVSAYALAENDECPKVCPFLYSPVCGADTKGVQYKFANECELKITNCRDKESTFKKIKDGDC